MFAVVTVAGDLGRYDDFLTGTYFQIYTGVQALVWFITGLVFSRLAARFHRYTKAIHAACEADVKVAEVIPVNRV